MPKGLRRRYGLQHLHFITCSCYRRLPLLSSARAKNAFVKILGEVRDRYQFKLAGYVVMPEHIHLLISEPPNATPSKVMQVLKQRVSRHLRSKRRKRASLRQLRLPFRQAHDFLPYFWQPRFYDFNESGEEEAHNSSTGLALEQFFILCEKGIGPNSDRSGALTRAEGKSKAPPFQTPERWGTRKFKGWANRPVFPFTPRENRGSFASTRCVEIVEKETQKPHRSKHRNNGAPEIQLQTPGHPSPQNANQRLGHPRPYGDPKRGFLRMRYRGCVRPRQRRPC